ncbi:MAG: YacP-like NYN domain protein [Pelotomaculum sp. PtaU1.Bin065]|nr:MAG: YacP-like NYN domain protein [Pelotomaculum sp. PtaU1.Bin065]
MREYLIVDGYNIIFAWPEFEKLKESSIDYARSKLVAILADYSSLSGQKVIVVFDAYKQKNITDKAEIIDGVEVVFTQQGETADTLIERLAGNLSKEGLVYVATLDWAEQGIIFGRGAYRITPGELRMQVNHLKLESEELWSGSKPADSYLENRLLEKVRLKLERWRREKG